MHYNYQSRWRFNIKIDTEQGITNINYDKHNFRHEIINRQ